MLNSKELLLLVATLISILLKLKLCLEVVKSCLWLLFEGIRSG